MRSGLETCVAMDRTAIAQRRAEELVIEHQTKLARYLRRMVGDAEVALDLTQDVFLSAYRTLQADPARELRAGWLYRAATNAAISFMRRRKILHVLRSIGIWIAAPGASTSTGRSPSICRRRSRACRWNRRRPFS